MKYIIITELYLDIILKYFYKNVQDLLITSKLINFLPEIFFITSITFIIIFYVYFNEYLIKNRFYLKGINSFFFLLTLIIFLLIILFFYEFYLNNLFNELVINNFINFIKIFITILFQLLLLFIFGYIKNFKLKNFEFFYLLLSSFLGLILILNAENFITLYLAIEIFNLSIYVVIALQKNRKISIESGLKFFVIGSISSALLLQSFALIYYFSGTLNLKDLDIFFLNEPFNIFILYIIFLVTLSFSIKMVLAPFYQWAVDVYDGSPFYVTFYLSLLPKIVYSVIFIKLYYVLFINFINIWKIFFILLIVSSIIIGVFGAIQQIKIKKFIIYSMIANSSFLLIPFFLVDNEIDSLSLLIYFSFVYSFNLIGIFFLFFVLFNWSDNILIKNLKDLINFDKFNKVLSIFFLVFLGSLAGLPPFAGFFPKIYLIILLYYSDYKILFYFLVVLNSIGIYYYIRILKLVFFNKYKFTFIFLKPFKNYLSFYYYFIILIGLFNIFFLFFSNDLILFFRELIFKFLN